MKSSPFVIYKYIFRVFLFSFHSNKYYFLLLLGIVPIKNCTRKYLTEELNQIQIARIKLKPNVNLSNEIIMYYI
jgi:hypothetical protein